MGDAATTSASSTTTTTGASSPSYANNPADPTTWSPAYAAQMQQAMSQYAAAQQLASNQATLAQLQPCAELAGPAFVALMAACKAAAPNVASAPLNQFLQNLSQVGALAAAEFSKQFLAVGGSAPPS